MRAEGEFFKTKILKCFSNIDNFTINCSEYLLSIQLNTIYNKINPSSSEKNEFFIYNLFHVICKKFIIYNNS